ncbi:MAG: AMP-binding protein [Ignavibacteriales bacterium]|nr:AMP-binding protein [Ignavibacteriales bacterium]
MYTPTENTLLAVLEHSAAAFAPQCALSYTDEPQITYNELKKQIDHLSAFLRDQGVAPGDRVAIIGENGPHWGIAYFAITCMGAVVVPILPDFHTSEIHHILRHSGAKTVFVSERFYQKVEDLGSEDLSCVILLNDFSMVDATISKATLKKLIADGSKELKKIRSMALRFAGIVPERVREEDLAAIIYTSGTTGHSKGVMLTHKNLVWNAARSSRIPPIESGDRMLSILPLAHVYECTLGLILPLMQGASVFYVKKPPTAAVLLPALSIVRPTAMLTVPLIIEKMYKARILPEIRSKRILRMMYKFPIVRKRINRIAGRKLMATFGGKMMFFGVGGSALSADVEKFLREAKFPYAIGYGLTETSPLVAGANAEHTRFRSTGPVVDGLEVKIDNPDPTTGEGEIVVRGPSVMKGYYRDPEHTAEVLSADGWFRTGDLGRFDENQYLYIKGRIKNVILGPTGENIYPEAIESVINRRDEVLESLVFQEQGVLVARLHLDYEKLDVEAAELGLKASEVKERITLLLEDIKKQVNDQVSAFSRVSKIIEQTEPFEKTPTQKIKRYLYTS